MFGNTLREEQFKAAPESIEAITFREAVVTKAVEVLGGIVSLPVVHQTVENTQANVEETPPVEIVEEEPVSIPQPSAEATKFSVPSYPHETPEDTEVFSGGPSSDGMKYEDQARASVDNAIRERELYEQERQAA